MNILNHKSFTYLLTSFLFFPFFQLVAHNGPNGTQPIELGTVKWHRNFDEAIALSTKYEKPIFLLFQEVPGCTTCRNYGQNVLSHPLIVEAIETLFVPMAVYNNKGGADAEVLAQYKEPAWNNPVVRIVNADKQNLVPRVSGNYSQLGVVQAMKQALKKEYKAVPGWLDLLEQELRAEIRGTEMATLAMYCFWTGEKELGKLEGVVETQAGFMGGREVVQVKFDPELTSFHDVLESAKAVQCASEVFTQNRKQQIEAAKIIGKTAQEGPFRADHQPKYYLARTAYRFVPMTQLQAARVNSLIGQGKQPDTWLSPTQLELLAYIQQHPKHNWKSAVNVELEKAWELVRKVKNS